MRSEPALSPVARIVIAIAIGVVAMLVPSCGGGLDRLDSAGVALKGR